MNAGIHMATAVAAAAFAASCFFAGCGRNPVPADQEPDPGDQPGETAAIDPVEALAIETDELFYRGETNAVVERFTAALGDEAFAAHRPRVFSAMLRFLLVADLADEAKARMDAAFADGDFDMVRPSFGYIYGYLGETGKPDEAEEWMSRALAVEGLPRDLRRQGLEWSMNTRLQLGDAEGARDRAVELARDFPEIAADVVGGACDRLFIENALDKVEALLAVLTGADPQPANCAEVALAIKIRLSAAKGEWDMARETFIASSGAISDQRLQKLLRNLARAASKEGRTEFIDALCADILQNRADKAATFSLASRLWVENAAAAAPEQIPSRLSRLLELGAPASQVCSLFMRTFYNTTRINDTLVEMIELGRRLDPLNDDEDIRTFIRTSVVDGSFILGRYDAAIEMLEKGIPGRDEQWTRMALSKVRAHKALYDEDWRDAVKHFREFMATVAGAKDEDTIDPESQVRHTKNMILGRNAKRIGDILMKIPDEPAAAAAYAEARDYFAKAREECADDPDTLAIIEKEAAEVP